MTDSPMVERVARAIEAEAVGRVYGDSLRSMLGAPAAVGFDKITALFLPAAFHDERDARRDWMPVIDAALK